MLVFVLLCIFFARACGCACCACACVRVFVCICVFALTCLKHTMCAKSLCEKLFTAIIFFNIDIASEKVG